MSGQDTKGIKIMNSKGNAFLKPQRTSADRSERIKARAIKHRISPNLANKATTVKHKTQVHESNSIK